MANGSGRSLSSKQDDHWFRVAEFRKGNGAKPYVLSWDRNGSGWACSCPAWTTQRKIQPNGLCKHLRQLQKREEIHWHGSTRGGTFGPWEDTTNMLVMLDHRDADRELLEAALFALDSKASTPLPSDTGGSDGNGLRKVGI